MCILINQLATKMESVDVKSSTYSDYDKKNNDNGPKFKVLIM